MIQALDNPCYNMIMPPGVPTGGETFPCGKGRSRNEERPFPHGNVSCGVVLAGTFPCGKGRCVAGVLCCVFGDRVYGFPERPCLWVFRFLDIRRHEHIGYNLVLTSLHALLACVVVVPPSRRLNLRSLLVLDGLIRVVDPKGVIQNVHCRSDILQFAGECHLLIVLALENRESSTTQSDERNTL